MIKRITGALFVLMVFASISYAASFNCKKASTLVEKAICSDPELSELDEQLAKSYKQARNNSANPKKLKQQQRHWLRSERNQCQTIICLQAVYKVRISELGNKSTIDPVGKYERTDGNAIIEITPLPNDKYYISGNAVFIRNEALGQINMGELDGAFNIKNNHLNYADDGCQVEIQFFESKLVVTNDNMGCGGLNVSFDGDYLRTKSK